MSDGTAQIDGFVLCGIVSGRGHHCTLTAAAAFSLVESPHIAGLRIVHRNA